MPVNIRKAASNLTVQVIVGLVCGVAIGIIDPALGAALQVLSDLFIKLIRMVIPPIAFLTIVIGIAEIRDLKRIGRVGGRSLVYFEVVSTLALAVGLVVMNVLTARRRVRPGACGRRRGRDLPLHQCPHGKVHGRLPDRDHSGQCHWRLRQG